MENQDKIIKNQVETIDSLKKIIEEKNKEIQQNLHEYQASFLKMAWIISRSDCEDCEKLKEQKPKKKHGR